MRIVHAIRSDGFAGVERHVSVLARAQAQRGDEVAVIGGDQSRMAHALGNAGVRQLPGDRIPDVIRAIRAVARGGDVVHTHMTAAEFAAAVASLVRGADLLIVTTRHFAAERGRSGLGRVTAGFIASRIAAQLSISQYVAEHVDGASEVVYPGVEPVNVAATPRQRTVLVVQRLEDEKRTDVAISAFARSGLADLGWRLRIAGDGSQRSQLERQAADDGVADAVEFLGTRSDVPALMSQSGLLLAPCPVEGLGLVVLEAMAAQLPVVASAAGGHLETLPAAAHASCFPPNDLDAAARSLRQLVRDEGRQRHLAELGLARQQQLFTPSAQAEATQRCYEAALNASGRRSGELDELE